MKRARVAAVVTGLALIPLLAPTVLVVMASLSSGEVLTFGGEKPGRPTSYSFSVSSGTILNRSQKRPIVRSSTLRFTRSMNCASVRLVLPVNSRHTRIPTFCSSTAQAMVMNEVKMEVRFKSVDGEQGESTVRPDVQARTRIKSTRKPPSPPAGEDDDGTG